MGTRERPILFSGAMVRAILAGTKTQTRRPVMRACGLDSAHPYWPGGKHGGDFVRVSHCPFGAVGDRLWVRETFCENYFGDAQPGTLKHGYRADWSGTDLCPEPRWTPSIHMPRWASRITIEITDVRVQRLHEITEEDARAEGVAPLPLQGGELGCWWTADASAGPNLHRPTARGAFRALWDSINGERSPWELNPWVWAITFRKLEAT